VGHPKTAAPPAPIRSGTRHSESIAIGEDGPELLADLPREMLVKD